MMDLDTKIIAVFCRIDDALKGLFQGQRLRKRGPEPLLSDAEVLTIEAVGEFLGLNRDTALYRYFRQHYSHFFPAVAQVCHTTFVRQAANLFWVKEQVLSTFSENVFANWPAEMSHSPHGECDFDAQRTIETPGSE